MTWGAKSSGTSSSPPCDEWICYNRHRPESDWVMVPSENVTNLWYNYMNQFPWSIFPAFAAINSGCCYPLTTAIAPPSRPNQIGCLPCNISAPVPQLAAAVRLCAHGWPQQKESWWCFKDEWKDKLMFVCPLGSSNSTVPHMLQKHGNKAAIWTTAMKQSTALLSKVIPWSLSWGQAASPAWQKNLKQQQENQKY